MNIEAIEKALDEAKNKDLIKACYEIRNRFNIPQHDFNVIFLNWYNN